MDLGACLVLIFLFCTIGVVFYHSTAQDRARQEDIDALSARQARLEAEQRATGAQVERLTSGAKLAGMMAENAVVTAQRAEENALAARALVNDIPPTRQA